MRTPPGFSKRKAWLCGEGHGKRGVTCPAHLTFPSPQPLALQSHLNEVELVSVPGLLRQWVCVIQDPCSVNTCLPVRAHTTALSCWPLLMDSFSPGLCPSAHWRCVCWGAGQGPCACGSQRTVCRHPTPSYTMCILGVKLPQAEASARVGTGCQAGPGGSTFPGA